MLKALIPARSPKLRRNDPTQYLLRWPLSTGYKRISSIIQAFYFIKIQLYISEQEKKRQRIYGLLNAKTKPKVPLSTIYKTKKILFFFYKRGFKEKGEWRIEQILKKGF